MKIKKLFALVLSLVFICSSFIVVSADSTAAASVSSVEITVTDSGLSYAAVVPADVVSANPELAVTFTQKGTSTTVTESAAAGDNYVFSFTSADTSADVSVAIGNNNAIVCTPARFNGTVGTKYVVYAALTLGNANGDTATDIKDVVRTKKIVAGAATATDVADLNGDGSVTVTDLVFLAKYIISAKKGMVAHTVTFKDADGTVLETATVISGFKAVPTVVPTKNADGYDFDKWDTSLASISADTVVTAVYSQNLSGSVPGDWEYDEETDTTTETDTETGN